MQNPENLKFGYNPAIDGLRAIAVIAVVVFHVGLKGVPGGFVGVDVFFVISGFLITGILYKQIEEKSSLNLAGFYAKRFRRLFPSLFLTIFGTAIFSTMAMFPSEIRRFGGAIKAASLAISNHYFLRTTRGYFDPEVDYMPLLHTWSLGVEEQFYFVWPFFLILAAKFAKRQGVNFLFAQTVALGLIAIFSYAYCYYFSYSNPHYAFYLMPLRAWEFAIGGIAYAAATKFVVSENTKNFFGVSGLLLIFGSIVLIDQSAVFPGLVSLLPCFGSAFLLFAIAHVGNQRIFVARFLSSKPLVWIGLVSYSFYLLHWPFLSIGRILALGEANLIRDTCLAFASLLASVVIYVAWERPLRYSSFSLLRNNRSVLIIGFLLVMSSWLIGKVLSEKGEDIGAAIHNVIYPAGDLPNLPLGKYVSPIDAEYCFQSASDKALVPYDKCSFGVSSENPPDVLLWGDSHALISVPMLNEVALAKGAKVLVRASGGCPPIIGAIPFAKAGANVRCTAHNELVMDDVVQLAQKGLKAVVLVARWNNCLGLTSSNSKDTDLCALYAGNSKTSPDVLNGLSPGKKPLDTAGSKIVLQDSLRQTIDKLHSLNLRVLIIAPIPELPFQPRQCLVRNSVSECKVSFDIVEKRRRVFIDVLDEIKKSEKDVYVFDPISWFCDMSYCYVADKTGLFYGDDNHLTFDKSASLASAIREVFDSLIVKRDIY